MKFFALGGQDELKRNCYVLEIKNEIIVFNFGAKTPLKSFFGVDYIIPESNYLQKNISKIKAIIFSNTKEESMGGLPFVLEKFHTCPIYVNKFMKKNLDELINSSQRWKLKNLTVNFKNIEPNKSYALGNGITLKTFYTPSDSLENMAYIIETPEGNVGFVTDFIVCDAPIWNTVVPSIISSWAKEKIDVLIAGVNKVSQPGYTYPNVYFANQIEGEMLSNLKRRFVFCNYEDNFFYVKQIIELAIKYDLPIFFESSNNLTKLHYAQLSRYIKNSKLTILNKDLLKTAKACIVIITSSSKDLFNKLLDLCLESNENFVFNSETDAFFPIVPMIPGSEKNLVRACNEIIKSGVPVFNINFERVLDLSASQEDLRSLLAAVKPKVFIPINAMNKELMQAKDIAENTLVKITCPLVSNGTVLSISSETGIVKKGIRINCNEVCVDGTGVGDVSHLIITERKILSNNGVVFISFLIDKAEKICSQLSVDFYGIAFSVDNEQMKKNIIEVCMKAYNEESANIKNFKQTIKNRVGSVIYKDNSKSPLVLPISVKTD